MIFKLQGTKISSEEKIMEVQTKLTDKNKREYKINNFTFTDLRNIIENNQPIC